jgi:hypothetical protein
MQYLGAFLDHIQYLTRNDFQPIREAGSKFSHRLIRCGVGKKKAEPPTGDSAENRTVLSLDDFIGPKACSADLYALDSAAFIDANLLKIRLERPLGVLDQLETNATRLLGQTAMGDIPADDLLLAADIAFSGHDMYLSYRCFQRVQLS